MAPFFLHGPATAPPPVTLDIPMGVHTAAQTAPRGWTKHTVRAGETLYDLALKHNVSVNALAVRNKLGPNRMIYTGLDIWVPRSGSGAAPARGAGHSTKAAKARHTARATT